MLALIGNLSFGEIFLILLIAVLVFGRRLPEVAAQGAHQLGKLRRSLHTMWRDTGLAEEWRTLQRDVDRAQRLGHPPDTRHRALPRPQPFGEGLAQREGTAEPRIAPPPGTAPAEATPATGDAAPPPRTAAEAHDGEGAAPARPDAGG